jgi:ABC-type antimicrobial peptide transport system permease subunit
MVHLTLSAGVAPETLVSTVKRAVHNEFPDSPVVDVATGRDLIARDIGRERLGAWFFSSFGLVALVLSVAGVFGLVAYLTESRRREVGIRTALGARPDQIVWLFMSSGLGPVLAGTITGLAVAALISRAVNALLLGVSHFDPETYASMALVTVGTTAVAALAAAWRVRSFSPSEALRAE